MLLKEVVRRVAHKSSGLQGVSLQGIQMNGPRPARWYDGQATWEGDFNCSNQGIKSLESHLVEVTGCFRCSGNKLTSLRWAPKIVGESFVADEMRTLVEFDCRVDRIGEPGLDNRFLSIEESGITSFHDVHRCFKEINGGIFINDTPIKECVLGLLLIGSLTAVHDAKEADGLLGAIYIVNEYLKGSKSRSATKYDGGSRGRVVHCQNELLDAGLEEYAKL